MKNAFVIRRVQDANIDGRWIELGAGIVAVEIPQYVSGGLFQPGGLSFQKIVLRPTGEFEVNSEGDVAEVMSPEEPR